MVFQKEPISNEVLNRLHTVKHETSEETIPSTKINQILYEIDGIQLASTINLQMGHYTIRLDPDAQRYCTLITTWGKYKYLRLPMGISCAPDMFQEKMSNLVAHLDFTRAYIDDLLVLTN